MSERKRLDQRVPFRKVSTQSSGDLYDDFLSNTDGSIHKWHHYFDIYERHLARYRNRPLRMLEIGVQNGGSLGLWSRYFGDQATIVGIDVDPNCKQFDGNHPNTAVRIGDQRDTAFLADIEAEFGPFDVILDDGGHTALQQIESFNFLYPEMTPDGVYLCEDTHTSYWARYQDAGDQVSMITYARKLVDALHAPYQQEDLFFTRFNEPPERRAEKLFAYRFVVETFSIQFYDSIIVFERRPRAEPYQERR